MRTRTISAVGIFACLGLIAGCTSGESNADGDQVEIEFSQWWEVELDEGVMRDLMDRFEDEHPNIKVELISNPYGDTMDQQIAGAATGTLSDIVAINGETEYDLYDQGAITDFNPLMEETGFDKDALNTIDEIDDGIYMVRALNFSYPMYYNLDVLEEAGVEEVPDTRSEFDEMAEAVSQLGSNIYAWSLPLSATNPAGFDPESIHWASGERFMDGGTPQFDTPEVVDTLEYLLDQHDAGYISPGSASQEEQTKVEEFTANRNAAMVGSLAHINGMKENNPDLNFTIAPVPAKDDYTGDRGLAVASWGLGIAENSDHKEEAWTLIEWLLSEEINSELATEAIGFPGNKNSEPDYVEDDELFADAFDIYENSELVTEFDGYPKVQDLKRNLHENLIHLFEGDQTPDETANALQEYWSETLS